MDAAPSAMTQMVFKPDRCQNGFIKTALVTNNQVEVKFVWQISYPPANGASQGNYFLPKYATIQARILTVKGGF